MTQTQLNRAVSAATGEDRDVIARRGFSLLDEELPEEDDDLRQFIDWDQLEADMQDGKLPNRNRGGMG